MYNFKIAVCIGCLIIILRLLFNYNFEKGIGYLYYNTNISVYSHFNTFSIIQTAYRVNLKE